MADTPRAWCRGLIAAALTLAAALAAAAPPAAQAASPTDALQARVMAVAEELRCLVCQNETVAASTAPLAQDLRDQIRRQLAAGRSEDEVMAYMSARYGDFVHYRPPLDARTLPLWWGPFALLLIGSLWLWRRLRRSARAAAQPVPDAADRDRLLARLDGRWP